MGYRYVYDSGATKAQIDAAIGDGVSVTVLSTPAVAIEVAEALTVVQQSALTAFMSGKGFELDHVEEIP